MSDMPGEDLGSQSRLLEDAYRLALTYLGSLRDRPAAAKPDPESVRLAIPEKGLGAEEVLRHFRHRFLTQLSGSPGPRYLGFVTGGATPAALAADWLVSTFDQNAQLSGDTIAPWIEYQALAWLGEMLRLAPDQHGICVTGATMANFTGLATGRQWLGEQRGADVAADGLHAIPPIRVLSGAPHSSIVKALAMLGIGREAIEEIPTLPGGESVDVSALEQRLEQLGKRPVMVVANAGVVNNGDFDDLAAIGALRKRYGFWFHVDGAFGLVAGISPRYRHLTHGIELADSVALDGHKWLNVPYDAGYAFTRHLETRLRVFQNQSAYLGQPLPDPRHFLHLGPENSRRWRGLPLWFTLLAYGRRGLRCIVERNCDMAARLGDRVRELKGYRLVAPVRLNITCIALDGDSAMDSVRTLQSRLTDTGEVFMTPSVYLGQPILRAAFCNWQTDESDLVRIEKALKRVAPA